MCHNIANGIKPGSNSKKTGKHAVDCSKAVCWERTINYVRCINCSYNNVAKSISLLDKKYIFMQENVIYVQVRAFERYVPLRQEDLFEK